MLSEPIHLLGQRVAFFLGLGIGYFCLEASSLQLFAQDADRLYPVSGVAVTGKITEMTTNNVIMEIRGVRQNFPSNEIQRIVYEGEPAQLTRAKEAVTNEQWEEALENLKKIDFKSLSREEIKKDYEYYLGMVQARLAIIGQGDPKAASDRVLNFVKGNVQSFHFYDCSETLGLLAAANGAYDQAAKYFGAMARSPSAATKIKALFLQGNSNLSAGKVTDARSNFTEAMNIAANDASAKRSQKLASIGMIRCEIGEKKYAEAINKLRKLITETDNTDSELLSRIYNALGEAHLRADEKIEAALAYLHTDLLFTHDPESHAEALYHLSQLFTKIDPSRAADAKAKLKSMYGNSSWAKK